ncbi:MAG: segregation/condensation protein A [Desulfobacteraceae bacterium]|jgi:segregation and condensation protein A
MFDSAYSVKIDVFEGPMDLLVYLVRKNDVDITNIPIALITEQFLGYLDLLELMNIDYASEFLYMAATLAHIKSRMLLPAQEGDDEEDDPRLEIARPLMEYLKLKAAADILEQMDMLGRDTFKGNPFHNDNEPPEEQLISIGLFELVETFRQLSEKEYKNHVVDFSTNRMTVKERIIGILSLLEKMDTLSFNELLDDHPGKFMKVLTFLAILEMAKMNLIEIRQHIQSGMLKVAYI